MKLAAVVLASLIAFTGRAHADAYGPPGSNAPAPPQRRAELRQMILERFDRNHDGRLEPRERRQAARALRRLARRLMRDQNGARNAKLRRQVIERYDLDGD